MMGQAVGQQDRLFYEFNLEDRIPANHLLRRLDAVLDLSWLRAALSPFYSHTGCPSDEAEPKCPLLPTADTKRGAKSDFFNTLG